MIVKLQISRISINNCVASFAFCKKRLIKCKQQKLDRHTKWINKLTKGSINQGSKGLSGVEAKRIANNWPTIITASNARLLSKFANE
jgi:hypothetical protein